MRNALIALVLLLAGLEVAARIAARVLDRERGLTYDAELGWRPVANVEKRGQYWGNARVARTNSLGWRDAERTLAKAPGTRRILCLGDSYLFGPGVDDGERVNEDLEREIPHSEAWNLAVTGYGPDQHLRILELFGASYAPDAVVWFSPIANDLDDLRCDVRLSWPKPWYELENGALKLHEPDPSWRVRVRNASYLAELGLGFLQGGEHQQSYAPPWRARESLELYVAVTKRMEAVANELGARFLVVLIPSDGSASTPSASDAPVVASLRTAGIEPLWIGEALTAAKAAGEQLFLGDGHWNPAGHACVARAVAAALR